MNQEREDGVSGDISINVNKSCFTQPYHHCSSEHTQSHTYVQHA